MPFARFLVSWKSPTDPAEDAFTNTLYFNISSPPVGGPDYDALCHDIATVYAGTPWLGGRVCTVKAYDMADAEPRPVKSTQSVNGVDTTKPDTPAQVAVCLSYYVDRNLPSYRGRIYLGPYTSNGAMVSTAVMNRVIGFGQDLAGIGGVNVDWSLWSPKRQDHTRINHIWVDNSWDIIRSRKVKATNRVRADING